MSLHENEVINKKQIATNALSAAARLDRETETQLYRLFQAYFHRAEEDRRWVVWSDVRWDQVSTSPSEALVEAVYEAYCEDSFLPDYSARAIQIERSSRGRTWFLTRWAYEEGKHLLGLNEWLTRSGAFTNEQLRDDLDMQLRTYRWEPPYTDGIAVFVDMLAWELREIARYRALQSLAQTAGDDALVTLTERILEDEEEHRKFLQDSLAIIGEKYSAEVIDATHRVIDTLEEPEIVIALQSALALPPAA